MISNIIFDFNGTLFFDSEFHFKAWDEIVFELTGSRLTQELLNNMNGKNNKQIIKMIKEDISDDKNEYYSIRKEQLYRKYCLANKDVHLVNGAIELFNYLKEHNIPFNIASASIKENIDFFVEIFKLDQWFDVDKIVYDNGNYLNKIEMFKDASKFIGCNIEDALVFEDSKAGIKWAKDVNAYVVGIGDISRHDVLKQFGANQCICDFKEFDCAILKK